MAELADALDSGSSESNFMQVQVLFPAPTDNPDLDTRSGLFFIHAPRSKGPFAVLSADEAGPGAVCRTRIAGEAEAEDRIREALSKACRFMLYWYGPTEG